MRPTWTGTVSIVVLLALVFASLLFRDLVIGAVAGILAVVILAEAFSNAAIVRSPGSRIELSPAPDQGPGRVILYPGDESVRKVALVKRASGRVDFDSTVHFQSITPKSASGKGYSQLELKFSTPYAGEYTGRGLNLRVSGPLGLFSSETSLPLLQEYVVYPRTLQVAMGTLKLLGRGELGETPIDVPGIGTEFYEMRGYQPSDDYRDVNWKATARGGETMVVEHMREVGGGYLLVLDTRGEGFADRDSLASTFLTLANVLASSGVSFEIVVHDGERAASISEGEGPRATLELALRAALEQTRLDVSREMLELVQSRQRAGLGSEEQVLSQLLLLRRAQATTMVEKVDPWAKILERSSDQSTRNVIWVSGLFGDVAPLMELAWQARHYHDIEFVVADPCLMDEGAGPGGSKRASLASMKQALSSVGVRLYYGKTLVIAQKIMSA